MLSLINQYTVVLDACVLAPMPVCDTLLRLAEEPAIYIPKWSAKILEEVELTLQKMKYPKDAAERRVRAMRDAFEEVEVTGYESLIDRMTNDKRDRHVLAAAVHCGAHAIVTDNVSDFPAKALSRHDIEALTADQFLVFQFDLAPELIIEKLNGQAADIGVSLTEVLRKLEDGNAPKFARMVVTALS